MQDGNFVANDVVCDDEHGKILLITGPNMSGKSTYIRQVALLSLMAQIGSFIPARQAKIGIVDRIFTRVGASDELARGQSTFMVEMTETARILNMATRKSLVILDEIGRGTSTYDGISLAWAIIEFLHEKINCRTLFATHYHELTDLSDTFPRIRNLNVAVREWNDEVVFLHKIIEGATDKSYGIHVARLAGVPNEVLDRATQILSQMEARQDELRNLEAAEKSPEETGTKQEEQTGEKTEEKPEAKPEEKPAPRPIKPGKIRPAVQTRVADIQYLLFDPQEPSVVDELRKIDVNHLTPMQAFELVVKLKEMVR